MTTEMTPETQKEFNKAVETFRGTCNTLIGSDEMQFLEDNDLLEKWDQEIFECNECGWWCGDDERSEDDGEVCQECHDDIQADKEEEEAEEE